MWTFQCKQDWGGGVGDTCHNLLRYESWHLIFKQKSTTYYYFANGMYFHLSCGYLGTCLPPQLVYKDTKVRDPDLLIILEFQE